MPRKSEIKFRNLLGLIPKSRLTKAQISTIEENDIPPDQVEWYFGRKCEYWKVSKLKEFINDGSN